MYQCRTCLRDYPRTSQYFVRDQSRADGFKSQCKNCRNAQKSQYRTNNRPKINDAAAVYRESHREILRKKQEVYWANNRESCLETKRDYWWENRERLLEKKARYTATHLIQILAANKRYYWNNREACLARSSAYRKKNPPDPDKKRAAKLRRRARKNGLPHDFTTTDWRYALHYWQNCCAVCGAEHGLLHTIAADHWIPLFHDNCPGTLPANILPLCHGRYGCNNSKQRKAPMAWLTERLGARKATKKLAEITAFFQTVRHVTSQDDSAAAD